MGVASYWTAILSGDEAAEAECSILQIADDLGAEEWAPARLPPGLAGGNAGQAVFWDALYRRYNKPEFKRRRDQCWESAIDGIANAEHVPPNLYSGFTGIGWATALLGLANAAGNGQAVPDDEAHEELEEAMLGYLVDMPTPANYDLINGPVGWGLYSLERWPHPRAARALELIVDFLEARAEAVPDGIRWWTSPEIIPERQRKIAPNGYYNLGLSHGVPGICVLLAHALVRGVRSNVSARLLDGAVSWVLAQRIVGAEGLSFPSSVVEGKPPAPSRLAWCYGDLGVASGIHVTAQVCGNTSWSATALQIARRAATIAQERSGAVDAGLCHGTSGIAHIFNRFYQATDDGEFGAAARAWIRATLRLRQDGIGPGGYAAWRIEPAPAWKPMPGLLEGSSGIGLALLAATGHRAPSWDRFLFASPTPLPEECI